MAVVDPVDDIFKPFIRINFIHYACAYEAVDDGQALCAFWTAGKEKILSPQRYRSDISLYRVVVNGQAAILEIGG